MSRPRYTLKLIVGPYYFTDTDGRLATTSDVYYEHADGLIHARRMFDQAAGGAAKAYLYDRGDLISKYAPREAVAA